MPNRTSPAFTQRHHQALAALLAAERDQNGPSPALNRITAAITRLFAEDNPAFNRELFGKAARGTVPPATRPATLRRARQPGAPDYRRLLLGHALTGLPAEQLDELRGTS